MIWQMLSVLEFFVIVALVLVALSYDAEARMWKDRADTNTKLLNGETVPTPAKEVKHADDDAVPMKRLHTLTSNARVQIEQQRALKGLPRHDDLVGLTGNAVTKIMGLR